MSLEVSVTFRRFRELRKFKRSFRSVPFAESGACANLHNLYTCGLAERNRKGGRCQQLEAQMTNAANDVAAFARPALRLPTRLAVGFGLEALEASRPHSPRTVASRR